MSEMNCSACEQCIEDDEYRIGQDQETYHQGCFDSEFDYASTVMIIQSGQEPAKVLVASHGVYDEWMDEYLGDLKITRAYHRTDGWRGYYETRIEDMEEIASGWSTGDWGDSISDSKQAFNRWVDDLVSGEIDLPEGLTVALTFDPTSNVFSTGCGVWVNDTDLFEAALNVPAL